MFIKPFIDQSDITPAYYYLPSTIKKEKLNNAIIDAQNEVLRDLLGESFYNSLMGLYGLEKIHTNIAAGAVIVFTVDSTTDLSTGMYTRISGAIDSTGAVDINNKYYQITVINSTTFSIPVNATGSDFSGAFGASSDFILENNLALRNTNIIPFLAKQSMVYYMDDSSKLVTRSGPVNKDNKYSKHIDPAQKGNSINKLQNSANIYANRLIEKLELDTELEETERLYPEYKSKTEEQQKVYLSSIPIRPSAKQKYNRLFRNTQ